MSVWCSTIEVVDRGDLCTWKRQTIVQESVYMWCFKSGSASQPKLITIKTRSVCDILTMLFGCIQMSSMNVQFMGHINRWCAVTENNRNFSSFDFTVGYIEILDFVKNSSLVCKRCYCTRISSTQNRSRNLTAHCSWCCKHKNYIVMVC